jgi:hypothetical protein
MDLLDASVKIPIDTTGDRSGDLPTSSAAPVTVLLYLFYLTIPTYLPTDHTYLPCLPTYLPTIPTYHAYLPTYRPYLPTMLTYLPTYLTPTILIR